MAIVNFCSYPLLNIWNKLKGSRYKRLTSILSDRGIFCCATGTACCTTGKGDATVEGSGPNIVGTKCPGA